MPLIQPTQSRSRLISRSGLSSSRSGERIHLGGEASSHSNGAARGKAIRTATANAATGSFGKAATSERKRAALSDKTNIQVSVQSRVMLVMMYIFVCVCVENRLLTLLCGHS